MTNFPIVLLLLVNAVTAAPTPKDPRCAGKEDEDAGYFSLGSCQMKFYECKYGVYANEDACQEDHVAATKDGLVECQYLQAGPECATLPPEDPRCSNKKVGYVSVGKCHSKFIHCKNGAESEQECEKGKVAVEKDGMLICQNPEDVPDCATLAPKKPEPTAAPNDACINRVISRGNKKYMGDCYNPAKQYDYARRSQVCQPAQTFLKCVIDLVRETCGSKMARAACSIHKKKIRNLAPHCTSLQC